MKLLFWNLQNNHVVEEVSELISESRCDICALCEATEGIVDDIVSRMAVNFNMSYEYYPTPGCDRIKIIIKNNDYGYDLLNQNRYFSLIKINRGGESIISGFVHFPSKLHYTLNDLRRISEKLRNQLYVEEVRHTIDGSLLIGDFNVDPFEMPMISFDGMGATNGVDCSRRISVTKTGETAKLFYNPMWTLYSLYKDRPGTHRYLRTGEDIVSWHFLDQVLIRPSLIDRFNFDSLRLVDRTQNYSFVNDNSFPVLSDHLPLVCDLTF